MSSNPAVVADCTLRPTSTWSGWMALVRVAVMVMAFGPGCPNITPIAKRAVSEQTSGAPFDVALERPTIAPAFNPAAPAICCALARASLTRSAKLQLGACCAEMRVPDNVKDRVSPLSFCEIVFCNDASAAVVSFDLANGSTN